jgi:hypothetical protein
MIQQTVVSEKAVRLVVSADIIAKLLKEHLEKVGINTGKEIQVNGVFIGSDNKSYQTFYVIG